MMILAKVFASILGVIVISRSIIDYKSRRESLFMTLFWIVVWVIILAIAYYPMIVDFFIQKFGGQRTGIGTVLGMAIAFLLFISYRVYVKANRVEKAMGKIIRELSLQNIKNEKK